MTETKSQKLHRIFKIGGVDNRYLITDVYDKIYEPMLKRIKQLEEKKITKMDLELAHQLQEIQSEDSAEIVRLRNEYEQLHNKYNQLQVDYDNLTQGYQELELEIQKRDGTLERMPKNISLIHKHIRESPDGLTASELSREIKKSRTSVYRTLKWLVAHNHIFKYGTRYLDPDSPYV